MTVNKTAVVEASLAILNREGLQKLNMRSIASDLGIKAASLYNHVKNKDDLYNEIVDYLCAKATEPDLQLPPRDYILQEAESYRQMLLSVRDIIPIFDQSMPSTPVRLKMIKNLVKKIAELGVARANLMTVSNMINNYIMSFTEYEIRVKQLSSDEMDKLAQIILPEAAEVASADASPDFDVQFQLGLEIILKGIESLEKSLKKSKTDFVCS